jgi:general secretion pathway protein C
MLSGDRIGASARSDIKLIGTISGSQQQGYAIFLNNNSQQEVVKTGESVTGIGTLKEVLKDKVVIQGAEGIDEIPFAEINVVEDGSRQQGKNVGAGTISPSFVKSMGGGAYLVDQKSILHALDKPNQLMTDARLQPNMVSGRQEGFVLREVKGGGIYHTLGLQNGDVLLRINSMDISSPDSALQAFTALRGMDRVNLDIIRNGSRMTLNYQMR